MHACCAAGTVAQPKADGLAASAGRLGTQRERHARDERRHGCGAGSRQRECLPRPAELTTFEHPAPSRAVGHHPLRPLAHDAAVLLLEPVLGRGPRLPFADHGAHLKRRDARGFAELELVAVLLHPRKPGVLEYLGPLLRRGGKPEERGDAADATLVVGHHLAVVQEQHVGLVPQRPPRADKLAEKGCERAARDRPARKVVHPQLEKIVKTLGGRRVLLHAPRVQELLTVREQEGVEGRHRLLRAAHHHHVLQVIAEREQGPGCKVSLERARHARRHRRPAGEELLVRLVGPLPKLQPRNLHVHVLEVGVTPGAQLMKDVHRPGGARLGRDADDGVAGPELRLPRQLGGHPGGHRVLLLLSASWCSARTRGGLLSELLDRPARGPVMKDCAAIDVC
mmetsp:Transcript_45635/g.116778  ORF Transcript_45635/g.116778 Transcript_45635/m.116778 type:complete len:396 (+) Transcript_45635:162-1349(+)